MHGSPVLTKVTRYKTQGKKRIASRAYRESVRRAVLSLTRSVILCSTPEQVDAAAALAQLVSAQGMSNANYLLFLALLETNNPLVIDVLVGTRNPFLLFAPIRPNWYLLREAFRVLARYKCNELSEKALLALMGVVQNAYKTSKDGYKIYRLSLSDIYSIGKHLDKERGQLEPRNRLLLDILFDIYYVGIDGSDRAAKRIGIKANEIRMAFFDHAKKMADALPDILLVRDAARTPVGPRSFLWEGAPAGDEKPRAGREPAKSRTRSRKAQKPPAGRRQK